MVSFIFLLAAFVFFLAALQGPAWGEAPPASRSPVAAQSGEQKKAQDYLRMGRLSANLNNSIKYMSQAIALNPDFMEAYLERGWSYLAMRKYDLALADFNKAISLNPKQAEPYVRRGTLYLRQQQYERALPDFNQAIALNSTNFWAYQNRGRALCKLGRLDEALRDFDRALSLNPVPVSETLFDRGRAYLAKKAYSQAIADFTKVIAFQPRHVEAYFYRAEAYQASGEPGKAQKDLEKVKFLKPDFKGN